MARISVRFSPDMPGAFWDPATPEKSFTGTVVRTKKRLVLRTAPIFKEGLGPEDWTWSVEREIVNCLHAFTPLGPCTLFHLQAIRTPGIINLAVNKAVTYREYVFPLAVVGRHISGIADPVFSAAEYRYSGLNEWLVFHPPAKLTDEALVVSYPRDNTALLDCYVDALQLRLKLEFVNSVVHSITEPHRWISEPRLLLEADRGISLEQSLLIADRLEHFFSLLLGCSVGLKSLGFPEGKDCSWLIRGRNVKAEALDHRAAIRYDMPQLQISLRQWLSIPDRFRALESLVYGTIRQTSMFVETEFLSLAQAIEAFHRITSATSQGAGTKISFRTRIEELLTRVSAKTREKLLGDAGLFETNLRETRNYFTHVGTVKKSRVILDPGQLFLLNQKLHAFLRLLLLLYVGFREEAVIEAVQTQATMWN
jgi:hypothetical protein